LLGELSLDVEVRVVDLMLGGTKTPEFLAINPNGKLPALVDGDLALFESNAILIHLAERADSPLWPRDTATRSRALGWMFWQLGTMDPPKSVVTTQRVLVPMMGGTPDSAAVEQALIGFRAAAAILDDHLARSPWLAGAECTVADIALGGCLTYAEPAGLPIDDYPHFARWRARLRARPAFAASAPPPLPDAV